MRVSRLSRCYPGQLLTGILAGILIIGPVGCNGYQLSLTGGGGSTTVTSLFGFLINTDSTSDLLGTLRMEDGNAVFVYGTHQSDGNVEDVQAAVLHDKDGQEAAVNFDGGLLSKAKGFDGSTITITYDVRNSDRLTGHADIFVASADAANQNQTLPFDIDLKQAVADLAAQIKQLTGIDVSTAAPPKEPGRAIVPDELARTIKTSNSELIIFFAPFFVYAFAAAGYLMVQFMGRIMEAMVTTLVVLTQVMIVTLCAPFILMGELLRGAAGLSVFTTNIGVQLALAGVLVPKRPYL